MDEAWLETLRRAGASQTYVDEVIASAARGEKIDPLVPLRLIQQGRCAVCDEQRFKLVVDHDHVTGLVRGLLYNGCNSSEGRDFRAPWFLQYREDPPAARIGLAVMYGNHYPSAASPLRPVRPEPYVQRTTPDPYGFDTIPVADDWVDAMLSVAVNKPRGPRAITEAGVPHETGPILHVEAPESLEFRAMLPTLGYAPIPVDVETSGWRMALFEAFRWADHVDPWCAPGTVLWEYRARRAFSMSARAIDEGSTYLLAWAGR